MRIEQDPTTLPASLDEATHLSFEDIELELKKTEYAMGFKAVMGAEIAAERDRTVHHAKDSNEHFTGDEQADEMRAMRNFLAVSGSKRGHDRFMALGYQKPEGLED